MNEIWAVVHQERDALIQDLLALKKQQWTTPSLCRGWDIHTVLAHLVNDAKTTRIGFVSKLIAAGFIFDRINASGISRERSADPNQTLAYFQGVRSRTASAPAPLATRLVEIFVHGEDIRRPLGIDHEYPVAEVATALQYQAKTSVKLGGGKERVEGLRLIATGCGLRRRYWQRGARRRNCAAARSIWSASPHTRTHRSRRPVADGS